MNKNLLLFLLLLAILFFSSFFISDAFIYVHTPWQMTPWQNPDSLSVGYVNKYKIQRDTVAFALPSNSNATTTLFIQVDAWGLPFDESQLEDELSAFRNLKSQAFIHWRKLNQNKEVEKLELANRTDSGVFFFGGDSLEYDRKAYIPELGFAQMVLCQKCADSIMIGKLDSALSNENCPAVLAWTTQSSRGGNEAKIKKSLELIAELAAKHPNVRIVIQGTHRPILGTPETRKKYYAHWVPVVVLN